jgi:hypothetical protein
MRDDGLTAQLKCVVVLENENMEKFYDDKPHPLIAIHRRWAFYALQQLALHDLSLNPGLFERGLK